jgi:hypothetical protein
VLSCRKFAPRTGQMLPDFSTEINRQLQIEEISVRLKALAYFRLSFGIETFKTGVSQADVSIMC